MSPGTHNARPRIDGFPRVSGDEPPDLRPLRKLIVFSPRERG